MNCPLCQPPQPETVLWQDGRCRVIVVDEPGYPAFCRVIWQAHVAEMTDLPAADRAHLMAVTFATEAALREQLQPHKINLASLGNMVPHLHWHVIPRFHDDRHFPAPVWAPPAREGQPHALPDPAAMAAAIARSLMPTAAALPL